MAERKQPNASWQRVLAEQLLNTLLSDEDEGEAATEALKIALTRVLMKHTALQGAIQAAFAKDEDGYLTDFMQRPLGKLITDASTTAFIIPLLEGIQRVRDEEAAKGQSDA